jgi:outer membrane lipoprotein SlyB
MKKILSIFTIAIIFTACKSKTNSDVNKNMVLVDTTGLYKSNALTDVGNHKYVINDKAINAAATKPVASSKQTTNNTVENSGASNNSTSNASANSSTTATPVKTDKGMSHAAKGTIVGAGTGAITGAILNKDHRGTGAIIGAVIGAGTGYVIGRSTDKKTGRVARAKARKAAAKQ